jgi:hypothetical protein
MEAPSYLGKLGIPMERQVPSGYQHDQHDQHDQYVQYVQQPHQHVPQPVFAGLRVLTPPLLHFQQPMQRHIPPAPYQCSHAKGGKERKICNVKAAGVFLIEDYKMNPAIIFVADSKKEYTDAGGLVNSGEDPKKAAVRELREESGNTFNVNEKKLSTTSSVMNWEYRCYFLKVSARKGIYKKVFDDNHNTLKRGGSSVPHCWREKNVMTRVYVSQLFHSGLEKKGPMTTIDVYGNTITIPNKTRSLLKGAAKLGIINCKGGIATVSAPEVTLKWTPVYKGSKSFLKDTKGYTA